MRKLTDREIIATQRLIKQIKNALLNKDQKLTVLKRQTLQGAIKTYEQMIESNG